MFNRTLMLEPNTYFRTEEVNVSIFLQILSSLKLFDSSDGGSKCLGILIKKKGICQNISHKEEKMWHHRTTEELSEYNLRALHSNRLLVT